MKDYYATLGVREGAGAVEIKRAYRSLAIRYHPDKNPSPEAEELFKEINEAYDVLSDPHEKSLYDSRRRVIADVSAEPLVRHRDPRYRPKPQAWHSKSDQLIFMEKLTGFSRALNLAGFVLFFLFAVDYFLPYQSSQETMTNAEQIRAERYAGSIHIMTASGKNVKLYRNLSEFGSQFVLTQTMIYRIPMAVSDLSGRMHLPMGYMYRGYIIFPLFLLVASVVGIINRKSTVTTFNYSVGTGLLLIINYFLVF
jgi:curved DNA-binding protein CbpA